MGKESPEKYISKKFGAKLINTEFIVRKEIIGQTGYLTIDISNKKYFAKWSSDKENFEKEILYTQEIYSILSGIKKTKHIRIPKILQTDFSSFYGIAIFEYYDLNHTVYSEEYTNTVLESLKELNQISSKINFLKFSKGYTDINILIDKIKSIEEPDSIDLFPDQLNVKNAEIIKYFSNEFPKHIGKENTLVHGDFCPHNFCVNNDILILFDFEKSHIGNIEEDRARLSNFYMLHNPDFCKKIISDTNNQENLNAMRIYKALFLLGHYSQKYLIEKNTRTLRQIYYWRHIIGKLILNEEPVTEKLRTVYLQTEKESLSIKERREQNKYIR